MRIGGYEVLEELGRGGMGVVYRVRAPGGGEAALKLLARVDAQAVARFERERRLLASLGEERGFVPLLDGGTSPEGAWLVMPLVPGGTLRERLAAGPLGVEETLALGTRLARSLGEAHARGIVHRDVKPENVLFAASGTPLLADLGLAKHFDRLAGGGSQSVSLTREGAAKGTAGYMAPEQLEDARTAGPAADVFALGAVLHECLAGRPAFEGESAVELLARVTSGTPGSIDRSDVPAWLGEVLRRALARDPRARFADGAALARALEARGAKGVARSRRRALLVAGALLVPGALLVAALVPRTRAPGTDPAQRLADLARDKANRGDLQGAVADCSKAIELDPGLAIAWSRRAWARGKGGDRAGEIVDLNEALRLDPAQALWWGRRGTARHARGDREGALADLSKAIELDPTLARVWLDRGIARGEKGDVDGEVSDLTRALELDPGLSLARADLGLVRATRGDLDGALEDLTKAIALDPSVAEVWRKRGRIRALRGDRAGAIDDDTRAIELDPKLTVAWLDRGIAHGEEGDHDAAYRDLTRAIELDPKLRSAWTNRAAARRARGDTEGVIADFTKAIELEPGLAVAWNNRGYAKGEIGDWDGALADAERASELDPKLAVAWQNRGVARYNKGDYARAVADLERALELDPGMPAKARSILDEARKRAGR